MDFFWIVPVKHFIRICGWKEQKNQAEARGKYLFSFQRLDEEICSIDAWAILGKRRGKKRESVEHRAKSCMRDKNWCLRINYGWTLIKINVLFATEQAEQLGWDGIYCIHSVAWATHHEDFFWTSVFFFFFCHSLLRINKTNWLYFHI